MTADRLECSRCHTTDRTADIRWWWVNVEREARRDGRVHAGPPFAMEYRCRACREATRTPRENRQ